MLDPRLNVRSCGCLEIMGVHFSTFKSGAKAINYNLWESQTLDCTVIKVILCYGILFYLFSTEI